MSQDLYTYIQTLHSFVQSQERRIKILEKTVKTLSHELQEVKSRPSIKVDTIEYKFDQLKVETLEGTLNIGLNPSDLEGIEDFEVQNKGISANPSPKNVMKKAMEMEEEIFRYIEKDVPSIIKNYAVELNISVEDEHIDFIMEDIKRQIPQRTGHYLSQIQEKERSSEANKKVIEKIVKQMKKDIEMAIVAFLRNLPNGKKVKDDESSNL